MPAKNSTMGALCSLCVFLQVGIAEDAQNISPEAGAMMKQYENTKDPDWLLKAIASVDRQKTSGTAEMLAVRAAMLRRLASYYDPTYDVNPPPPVQSHVMPPMGYDTGVPPELVSDPKQREDYARRIEENRTNSQRHKTQTAIRQLMTKVVVLSLNAAHGNLESVEAQLQGYEMPQEMVHTMQALARETKKKEAKKAANSDKKK